MEIEREDAEKAALEEPGPEPLVGVVLVNYNSREETLRCLEALGSLRYRRFFTVVVDNDSPDGSGRDLFEQIRDPSTVVLLSPKNEGFAAACNIGIRYASEFDAQYVWLLNPDVIVEPGALTALVAASHQHPDAGALGSKVLYPKQAVQEGTNSGRLWSAGGEIDFVARKVRMLGWGEEDRGQYDDARECDYLPGCSLFIRREVIEAAGYMPEHYFMYFEETDWCTRIRRSGFALRYVPDSRVVHGFRDAKMQEPFSVYYYNRNKRLFWFRYASITGRAEILFRVLFIDLPRALRAYCSAEGPQQREVFLAHRSSCVDFLLGRCGRRRAFAR